MRSSSKLWLMALPLLALSSGTGVWARTGVRSARMLDEPAGLTAAEIVASKSLGGFRMVAVDLIWARAMDAWMRGEWHEAVASYETITRLQPRQESVWLFASYTLAFDMAHALKEAGRPDDALRIRLRGAAMIERGLRRNPKSALLAHAFGQILFHCGRDPKTFEALEPIYGEPLERACRAMARAGELDPGNYRHPFQLSIMERSRANRLGALGRFASGIEATETALQALDRCESLVPGLSRDTASLLHELTDRRAALKDLKRRLMAAASQPTTEKEKP